MAEISTKPYLIRAIYEWCCDNGYTPHLVVKAGGHARLPMAYVRNGEIVLNVSPTATNGLQMGNEVIEFQARFNGVPEYIVVPVDNVLAIFARETGFVVPFNIGPAAGADADPSGAAPAGAAGGAAAGQPAGGAAPFGAGQSAPGASQGGTAGGAGAAPASSGDVVDFRAARAARPGLKAVPRPGAEDASTPSASTPSRPAAADDDGPKGRSTRAGSAKDEAQEGAPEKGRSRSSGGSRAAADDAAPQGVDAAPDTDDADGAPRSRRKPASRTVSSRRKTTTPTDEGAADAPPAAAKPKATRSRKAGSVPAAPAEDGAQGVAESDRKPVPVPQEPPAGTRAPVPAVPSSDGPPDEPPPVPPSGGRPRLVRIK